MLKSSDKVAIVIASWIDNLIYGFLFGTGSIIAIKLFLW